MKKNCKKSIAAVLAFVLLMLCLVSCGEETSSENTHEDETKKPYESVSDTKKDQTDSTDISTETDKGETDVSLSSGNYELSFTSWIDGNCAVSGLTAKDSEPLHVVIPERSPKGEPVVSIGYRAFQDQSRLALIEIPKTVVHIDIGAFIGCTELTTVIVPDHEFEFLSPNAFEGCSKLQYTEYDNALYLGNKENPYSVLVKAKDNNITSCKIHKDTNSAVSLWTEKCQSLTSIEFDSNATKIPQGIIYGCNTITSVKIPDSVTRIGAEAFSSCMKLTSVNIPNGTTYIGKSAFSYCQSITSLTIPESVTYIGEKAFECCVKIESFNIPKSITVIRDSTFSDCRSITSIRIPDGVTELGYNAFSGCFALESVTLPNTLTKIGDGAFASCGKIEAITIPDNVTSLGNSVFHSCTSLKSISVPNGVTEIRPFTFYYCAVLTSVELPAGITAIGDQAFAFCTNITSMTYKGTSTQWSAIQKANGWRDRLGLPTVQCSDGEASL